MCLGCGACQYACEKDAIELRNFLDDGIRPTVDVALCDGCRDCLTVCPGHLLQHDRQQWPTGVIQELKDGWGPVLELWEGYAGDPVIRFKGGSGGAATALGAFCVEQEKMHGVLHVGMDGNRPYLNQTLMSTTRDELISRTGSRYAPAAVGAELAAVEEAPAPCAVIAKPCDIAAAQKARRIRPRLDRNLGLTIAIFCGGTPSTRGTLELLRRLGIEDLRDVADLRYRGNGWPGMTGVNLKTGEHGRLEMTYHQAWDTILTRHKPLRCHMCPDGTGEFADLSCGDPWYRPVTEGEDGRTLIVVRSERGKRLLQRAMHAGYIVAHRRDANVLPRSQTALLMRRAHIWPKKLALWCLLMPYPRFHGFPLWRCWLRVPLRRMPVALWRAARWMLGLRRRGPVARRREDLARAEVIIGGVQQPTTPSTADRWFP